VFDQCAKLLSQEYVEDVDIVNQMYQYRSADLKLSIPANTKGISGVCVPEF